MASKKELDKKKKIIRISITISILVLLIVGVFLLLYLTGWYKYLNSQEKIEAIINSGGGYWSRILFFILQFLQVTFIPIPAMVTTLAGVFLFGPFQTMIISFVACMLGSIFAFFLGRVVGAKLVNWMVGEDTCKKWRRTLSKGKYVFFLMMLFPAFPDDILCLIAGLTNMTWTFFIVTNVISRSINCAVMCYVSSGTLIPFHGWGIPVWIVLIGLCIVLFVCSVKYQKEIEQFIVNIGKKITRKFKKKSHKKKNISSHSKESQNKNIENKESENKIDSNTIENVSQESNSLESAKDIGENIESIDKNEDIEDNKNIDEKKDTK